MEAQDNKLHITDYLATFLIVSGVIMIFMGIVFPILLPANVWISATQNFILIATGELFTLAGTLLGIKQHFNKELKNAEKRISSKIKSAKK